MPLVELLTGSGLGSLLGMRHALEPDHLAAVTTLVSHERSSVHAALLGAWWGIGHTLALLVVGAALVLVRAELPDAVSDAFEFGVALMLIGLGIRSVQLAALQAPGGPRHLHRHGRVVHSHAAVPAHVHIGSWTFARRPLLVGAVHGLAGSGALTALVLATLPTTAAQLMYVLLFGVGFHPQHGGAVWPARVAARPARYESPRGTWRLARGRVRVYRDWNLVGDADSLVKAEELRNPFLSSSVPQFLSSSSWCFRKLCSRRHRSRHR